MTWLSDYADAAQMRDRAMKSLTVPMGLANPFWLAFGAAASAGAAWWLITRWSAPVNLEAFAGSAPAAPKAKAPKAAKVEVVAESIIEPIVEAAAEAVAVVESFEPVFPESVSEPVIEAAPETSDDLTRLTGVGPRTAAALAERGVTRFAHLAAWTPEQLAAFDTEMNLKHRSARDAWLAQAKRLAADA